MKTVEIKCVECGKVCYKPSKEIKRCFKRGRNHFFCCRRCSTIFSQRSRSPKGLVACEFCGKEFTTSINKKRKTKCCSSTCAKKLARKTSIEKHPDIINSVSQKTKNNWKNGVYDFKKTRLNNLSMKDSLCVICNKSFRHLPYRVKKTCSKDCFKKYCSLLSQQNVNCGGQTNYKKFIYKNISMDSKWEVEIAEFLDSSGIEWVRNRKILFYWTDANGFRRRYYPDFYIPKYNVYLDPKNKFLLIKDEFKLKQVIKENNINLIYGLKDTIIDNLKVLMM